jgi:hypothetical protein
MIENYVRYSDDLADEIVAAIEELEVSRGSARNAVGRHLKKVSMPGGEKATKKFLFAEARRMNEAISHFLEHIGMGTYIEQKALDKPLSKKKQKAAVEYNDGKVDEIVITSIVELAETESPGGDVELFSMKVIGRIGLHDVDPTLVEVVDERHMAVRVRGWIPDSDFA